ncbi:TIGR01906 family membrane protein [Enterococcus mediterraneensis]|uniref:TIGR01906 family membrane protein n=1 Tax=Enterococcus mediterraneensis TaxID=2364791 RepID=UPI0030B98DAA
MMKNNWRDVFGIILVFLTLISFAVLLTINFRPLYVWDIHHLNILEATDLTKEELLKNFDLLMKFLNNPFNHQLSLPDFPMSESGRGHFYDVKKLFLLDYGIFLVTLIPSLLFLRRLAKEKRLWKLILPFKWGMAVPVVLGSLMAVGFDTFFVKFHQMFFSNDDWLFDPATDPIINVLPEAYFMHCFILAFVLIEVFFFIMILIGKRSLKNKN